MLCIFRKSPELIVQELGTETLVYDPKTQTTHLLTGPSASIFQLCDGSDVAGITAEIDNLSGGVQSSEVVEQQLAELCTLGLVTPSQNEFIHWAAERRQFLVGVAKIAAALSVTTLAIPLPAAAQSSDCTTNTFALTTARSGEGALRQMESVAICISAGATNVMLEGVSGQLVDEILVVSAMGPGTTEANLGVSSFTPGAGCPLGPRTSATLPLDITSLFSLPLEETIRPTVFAAFCNGDEGGPYTLPSTQIVVT